MTHTGQVAAVGSRFSVIDLNQLGRMFVLEELDAEKNIVDRMLRFKMIWTDYDPPAGAVYDVENLEFDPIRILQECNAFMEVLLRDRVNQAARAVTLAFAISTDLDAIASRYPGGVPRLPDEDDDRYRRRIQLSVNPLSPHGPSGAYMFWALTADPDLRDASEVAFEGTGEVVLTIMDEDPLEPRPSLERQLAVRAYILEEYRKAATDILTVAPPQVIDLVYHVKVWFLPPPDKETLLAQLRVALEELIESLRWLGVDHTHLNIYAALKREGVHRAEIVSPAADVSVSPRQTVRVTDIIIDYMGRGE